MVQVIDLDTPDGYIAWDFFADLGTHMGAMELILDADSAGDIYQNSLADDPDVGAEEFDTYVTVGNPTGPNPTQTSIFGGAVDLGGGPGVTFDDQNIDIAWVPEQGVKTGRGLFQIARVMLKDTATGSWSLKGWQFGGLDSVTISGSIPTPVVPGDANGDGWCGGEDLAAIITNWGMNGATRKQGDLTGDGAVGAADYNEVLTFWGTGTPPSEPPPEAVPEPASLALVLLGGLLVVRRHRS